MKKMVKMKKCYLNSISNKKCYFTNKKINYYINK